MAETGYFKPYKIEDFHSDPKTWTDLLRFNLENLEDVLDTSKGIQRVTLSIRQHDVKEAEETLSEYPLYTAAA